MWKTFWILSIVVWFCLIQYYQLWRLNKNSPYVKFIGISWRIVNVPHPTFFFSKKWEKIDFFEKHTGISFFRKKLIFFKITPRYRLFDVLKNKNPMLGPIVFRQNPKIWYFFVPFNSRKRILKKLVFQNEIMIPCTDYEKKDNFVDIFEEKIDFFPFFCKNFHIFREKIHFLQMDTHALFNIFYFSEQTKYQIWNQLRGGGPNWRNFFSSDTKFIDLKKKIFSECAINPCKQFFTEWLLVLPSLTLEKFLELFLNFRKPNFSSLKSYTE